MVATIADNDTTSDRYANIIGSARFRGLDKKKVLIINVNPHQIAASQANLFFCFNMGPSMAP